MKDKCSTNKKGNKFRMKIDFKIKGLSLSRKANEIKKDLW